MTSYLLRLVFFSACVGIGAAGRWIYFHPERFWKILYADLTQEPVRRFWLRFIKLFGALIMFGGLYGVMSQVLLLVSDLARFRYSDILFLMTSVSLTGIGMLYLLKQPRPRRENDKGEEKS